jgi:lipopolysaccharide export system protein LptA
MRIRYLSLLLLLLAAWHLPAQTQPPAKSKSQVKVDWADIFENIQQDKKIIQKLRGNVELRQDDIFMYCDSATIEDNNYVIAQGNVIIQQGDTTSAFADSLVYRGDVKLATLFSNVALVNRDQKLFTERLDYDLNTKIATYFEGATLTNNETQLSSKRGYYYVRANEVFFRDSVVVIDPSFSLRADTLKFNTESRTVFFLGPTLITTDSSKIYCEDGFYNTANNLAEFRKNAQYLRKDQRATATIIRYNGNKKEYTLDGDAHFTDTNQDAKADVIRYEEQNDKYFLIGKANYRDSTRNITADEIIYDRKNELYSTKGRSLISDPPQLLEADAVAYAEGRGLGVASGNIIWRDTSANLTILCERADFDRKTNYLKASGGRNGRPMLITLIEEDSLYLSADTLLANQAIDSIRQDTSRLLFAYHAVRIFKSNLQAVCDSLAYTSQDSIFRLFQEPIIWSDTSQFVADTVHIQLRNERLDQIFLYNNAFIVNSPDEIYFNQIKGRNVIATFEESELRKMDVQGNAESVYYALDEQNAYIGVNKVVCSDMVMYFGNNTIDKIKFYSQPQSTLYPMRQANHKDLEMPGFRWEILLRPKSSDDVLLVPDALIPLPSSAPEAPEDATTTTRKQ